VSDPLRFTLPVTVGRIAMKVDRSVTITATTAQEISDAEFAVIHLAFQRTGWLLFSETNVDEAEVPAEDVDKEITGRADD
jgi:hypothetical protein